MTAERWRLLKNVFYDALERPAHERDVYIKVACGDDAELSTLVRGLLAETETTEGFLDHPISIISSLLPTETIEEALAPADVLCGRFEVVRLIARGGMGEVYEAWDAALRERVALKTIRSETASDKFAIERFKSEVRRARAIVSEHVCRVYDLFLHVYPDGSELIFLTMQLVVGESLAERLKRHTRIEVDEACTILDGILAGLECAHREGIVHGDLKAGNVLLTRQEDGRLFAVLTDFGLARRTRAKSADDEFANALACGGTPAYMAPEQTQGASPRLESDVYSFGVLAYETLTGTRPTIAARDETEGSVAETVPPPRSLATAIPSRWNRAIIRCIERDPEKRFHSATEVARAVAVYPSVRQWISLAGIATGLVALIVVVILVLYWRTDPSPRFLPASLAVLPFEDVSSSGGQYLADGFTEELTHALTRIPGLHIMGRDSVFSYRNAKISAVDLGRRLGARYVVTGSIRTGGGRVRVIARLVNAARNFQVWSRDFDGEERNIIDLQNRMALQISGALQVKLAALGAAEDAQTMPDLGARDLYWLGRSHWRQRNDESVRRSLQCFKDAVKRDPNYALAWTGLAESYCVLAETAGISAGEDLAAARDAALTSITLDSSLAETYAALGQISSLYDRDFDQSEQYFRKALQMDGSLVTAHQWYSYMLVKQRRFQEAMREARKAVDIDPLSVPANINLTVQLFYAGDYSAAGQQCRKLDQMQPKLIFTHLMTAHMLAREGRYNEAISAMENSRARAEGHAMTLRTIGEVNALAGRAREAEEAAQELISERQASAVPASYIAIVYADLNERDKAFEWLDKAYAEYDGFASMLNVYPAFDVLRSDPRFAALLWRFGIKGKKGSDSIPAP